MTISKRADFDNSFTRDTADFGSTTTAMLIATRASSLRQPTKRILLACLFGLLAFALFSPAAHAQTPVDQAGLVKVSNVSVSGFMDPHNEALIADTISRASKNGVSLYVLALDSTGVAGADVSNLSRLFKNSDVVTAIWVGPTSAQYSNELDDLVRSADFVGAANEKLAKKADTKIVAPSLREFYAKLDQKTVSRLSYTLDMGCSKKEVQEKTQLCKDVKLAADENFKLSIAPQFEKLSPIANLGHSLIKPGFAVGILVMGLCLLAFEFFAASVGVAAIAGVLACLCGVYGLGYLPAQPLAILAIVLGIFALIVDVQAGAVRLFTVIGTVLIFFGSYFATDRVDSYGVTIFSAAVITVMALLFVVASIPSLIRTRFGTAIIDRGDFIGEEAIADGDLSPNGAVKLRGGSFKARAANDVSIKEGEKCKVTGVDEIVIEVSPLP